jgi:predicted dehydrogenase
MEQKRREFLKVAGGAVALGLTARNHRALAGPSPNGRINVGFIGVGNMGTQRLKDFMEHADVNVAALCDVDEERRNKAASLVESQKRPRPPLIGDFRRLLDSKEIDAVCIATPDHWHALTTIYSCQAGKDVFVEKPLCHTIPEGRAMVEAVTKNRRITQLGNHIHNDLPNYRRVVEIVQSGMLGTVDRVYCWKSSGRRDIGNPPNGAPPSGLDYDFWLGPAPKRAFNPNRCHSRFRNFWDYSGGVFIDFWCHVSDLAYWALDLQAPTTISSVGARKLSDNGETPNTLDVLYEFPNGLVMSWNIHPQGLAGFESYNLGCVFQGSEGTLVADYETHDLYVKGKRVPEFKHPPQTIADSPGHVREFLDSIQSRQLTTCNVEYAHRLTKAGLLGNIAYRSGTKVTWDDRKERIIGEKSARRLLKRKYRKPWRLS